MFFIQTYSYHWSSSLNNEIHTIVSEFRYIIRYINTINKSNKLFCIVENITVGNF